MLLPVILEPLDCQAHQLGRGAQIPVGVCYVNVSQVSRQGGQAALYDADAERLGLVAEYEHPLLGTLRQFGETVHFSDTPGQIVGPAPRVGEHSREILAEIGVDDAEIDDLKDRGVVTWPDEDYPWRW